MNQMTNQNERGHTALKTPKKKTQLYVCYTAAFLLVSFIIFLPFILFGKTLVWETDGYLQWYPLLVKMKSIITDFFAGNGFSFWSWDTGLGGDSIGNYAIVLCDPFNYISLLFSKENMDIAYSVIIIAKLYAAGIVMLSFLRYHKKPQLSCIIGALGYIFCSWVLMGMRHDFFITQIILFPLLILGIDKIEDKKSPLLLIAGVFLSVVTSLYFSYMSAIFAALYIIIRYFLSDGEKTVVKFLKKILCYIAYAIVGGVLLAAPVLLSALYALLHTSTGSGLDIQLLPSLKQLFRYVPAFAGVYDVNANSSYVGANMLFVAMIPAMFLMRKKKKVSIWMFFISAAIVILPGIQSVLNGFSYSSGRWCYIFSFFFACAAIECFKPSLLALKEYKRGLWIWLCILAGTAVLPQIFFNFLTVTELAFVMVNLLFGFFLYFIIASERITRRKKPGYMLGAAFINIIVIPVLYLNPNIGSGLNIYMTQGQCYEIYEANNLKAAKEIGDKEFFRVDTVDNPGNNGVNSGCTHTPANAAIYWEVPTLSEYLSTLDKGWLDFNKKLGNNSGYFRRMCVFSNDNRSRMDFLLGVKYFMGTRKGGKENSQYAGYGYAPAGKQKGISVLKSKYNTSLGYVYDQIIPESDFMKYSALEREQLLMQGAELEDADAAGGVSVPKIDASRLFLEKKNVPIKITGSEGVKISPGKMTIGRAYAKVTVTLEEAVKNSEIYLVFRNLKKREMSPGELWEEKKNQAESSREIDALSKAKFYAGFLFHKPYGDLSIKVEKDKVKKRLLNAEGEAQAIRDIGDYMVNMGYQETHAGDICCTFETQGVYTFDSIEVIAVPQTGFDAQAKKLEQNRLQVEEYGDNRVKGSIDTEKGGILYLSIPYHDGWRVYVDGKEAEKVYRVNTAFMGVEVSAGKHKVSLVYRPVLFRESLLMSAVGAIAAAFLVFWNRRKRRRSA